MQSGQTWYGNRITWVVIIACLSACALLLIQGIWLKRTFEEEKLRLERDLDRAIPEFLFFQPALNMLRPTYAGEKVSMEEWQLLKEKIEHNIAFSFKSHDITTNYEYALLNYTKDSLIYSSNPEYNGVLKESSYQKCINCQQVKTLPPKNVITDNNEYDYLISIPNTAKELRDRDIQEGAVYLSLHFPEFDKLILRNILLQLTLVILFVLLLTGCFFYILRVVHKQKKIAEIKDDFINSLTHEFKTPLASMSLAATVLQESLSQHLTDRDNHHFQLMRNEQTHLENQIDKVLQMAMTDAENFELDIQSIDILALIRQTYTAMNLSFKMKKGKLSISPETGIFLVKGDPTHLANVFYNLIDNAIKYCDRPPVVSIELKQVDNRVIIQIADNGVGISEERQSMIFDKFYRVHQEKVMNMPGFGLGLSYVKRLIDLHRGDIDLRSTPGEGSIFTLSLPSAS